jgi:Tfp pilus assembly protein PilX
MKRVNHPRRTRQRGNVLIEFALMAVLLLLTTLGVTDFGRLFNTANMAANAAAAGTQYGSLSPAHYTDLTGMQNAALADAQNATGVTATASQVCRCSVGGSPVSCPASCVAPDSPETYIQVVVSVPFTTVARLPWIPQSLSVTGRSVVRVQ